LCISVFDSQKIKTLKTALLDLVLALLCALFGMIYELFSHGVYSYHMLYFFLFPLAGGTVPFLLLAWKGRFFPDSRAVSLYHAGLAALTVGSCASGILEIYGTTSDLIPIYWIFGSLTIGSALLLYGLTPKNNVEEK